ncbi:MAG: T9SS type A sorting domain-containing protein [Bacteroidales bacterium]|nr:T9SS type A sorting domain-containing protein [Bacteroidales bacterium]
MKKLLLLMIGTFLAVSATGQSLNEKTRTNAYLKQNDFEKSLGSSGKGERLDSTLNETYDTQWVISDRHKYTYSVNGSTTTVITSIRDASTGFIWANSKKEETTVNGSGKTTSDISYTWNSITSQWVASFKMEFTYDANGEETSRSSYTWNSITSQWVGLSRTEYTMDANGNTIMDTDYTWDITLPTPAWVLANKTEYTFTGDKMTLETSYNWDKTLPVPDWVKSSKTEHTYNADGKNILDIDYKWDTTLPTPDWVKTSKTEYTFDISGNVTLAIIYDWDADASGWVNSSKTEILYNADGKVATFTLYMWTSGQWVGFLKSETIYGVLPNNVSYITSTGYSWTTEWNPASRLTNYYSSGTTSIIDRTYEKDIRVYPNPAKEFIVFDLNIISESAITEIFDIQGKKVLEQRLSGDRKVGVSNLRQGLYLYKLYNNGIIYTGKFLIE